VWCGHSGENGAQPFFTSRPFRPIIRPNAHCANRPRSMPPASEKLQTTRQKPRQRAPSGRILGYSSSYLRELLVLLGLQIRVNELAGGLGFEQLVTTILTDENSPCDRAQNAQRFSSKTGSARSPRRASFDTYVFLRWAGVVRREKSLVCLFQSLSKIEAMKPAVPPAVSYRDRRCR